VTKAVPRRDLRRQWECRRFEKTVGVPPIAVGQTLHTTCATWLGTQRYSETGVAHNYSQNGFSGKGFQLSVVKPLPLKAEWGFWKCH
jgi:cellulase/cellobiase CelA1